MQDKLIDVEEVTASIVRHIDEALEDLTDEARIEVLDKLGTLCGLRAEQLEEASEEEEENNKDQGSLSFPDAANEDDAQE